MQNKKIAILLILLTGFFFKFSVAQSPDAILTYIARYKDLAIAEMQRTGIPAAITLAQGIHETEAGTSELVRKSNNHFGIKCKDNWTGETVSHNDDARGECFRKYAAAEDSYHDHSDFLKTRPNYASLFELDPTDYEAWAYGLKKAGYATNPNYAQILIKLIRDYDLQQYTLLAMEKTKNGNDLAKNEVTKKEEKGSTGSITEVSQKTTALSDPAGSERLPEQKDRVRPAVEIKTYPSGEFKINETRVVFVRKGTSYLTIAQQYEIPLARLFDFNDMKQQDAAASDQLVYIQRKRKIGDHEFHVVQPGETLSDIAQTEAIRLESLLEYNNLNAGMQPAAGETLYLYSKSPSMPKLTSQLQKIFR